VAGAVLPVFQMRIFHGNIFDRFENGGIENGEFGPGQFSKALGATSRNLSSNGRKGLELAGYEQLSANSKTFCTKQLRNFLFIIKLKAQF
jgi:hypothetical protein